MKLWEKIATDDLKDYPIDLAAIEILSEKIQMLNEEMVNCRSVKFTDTPPTHGSGERTVDDNWLSCISLRDEYKRKLKNKRARVSAIEKGLAVLSPEELLVLTKFYINRPKNYLDDLCEVLHVERSKVYNIRKNALLKFTITQHGIDA